MDAFASAHREHASTVGITIFASCIGFSVERELTALDRFLGVPNILLLSLWEVPSRRQLKLIETLLPKCDICYSLSLANSFLKTLKFNIGSSLAN